MFRLLRPHIKIYTNSSSESKVLFNKLLNYKLNYTSTTDSISEKDFNYLISTRDFHPDNKKIVHSIFNIEKYKDISALDYKKVSAPLIIDYKYNNIAADQASFNRLMSNYLTCGNQEFNNHSPVDYIDEYNKLCLVGPGMQEYADLF